MGNKKNKINVALLGIYKKIQKLMTSISTLKIRSNKILMNQLNKTKTFKELPESFKTKYQMKIVRNKRKLNFKKLKKMTLNKAKNKIRISWTDF